MMIGKIIRNLAKQLIVTGIVIAISIAIMSVNPTAGIILMMLYSSWMVIKSSNKEMPLNKFTALLPGLMSLATFFIMLELINVFDDAMPLIGMALGIIPGWLMARGHKVYKKDGILYAKRTFFYVLIWAISILFTQGSTLLGMREITGFASLLNGFSTAMLVVLSMILLTKILSIQSSKNNSVKLGTIKSLLVFTILVFSMLPTATNAQTNFTQGTASSLGSYSGAPPADKDWGVRYGKTEYRAILNPEAVRLMNARKGRWVKQNISGSSSYYWRKLNKWSFSGGRLIVDWDNNIATLEPIYTTASISTKSQNKKTGKIRISREEKTETAYLKDKQTGNGTHILFPVTHGLGYPVSIGPGSLAGKGATDTGFFITNSTTAVDTRRTNNFPVDKNQPKSNWFNAFDKQFPGCLSASVSLLPISEAADAIGVKVYRGSTGFRHILFLPVKTVGRSPSSPNLLGEIGSQDSGWGKGSKLTGTQVYKGRFLRASPSTKDKKDGIDVCANVRNAFCNDVELTIDWDSKTADLSSFSIQWVASNTDISQSKKYIKQNSGQVTEFFRPTKDNIPKVTFNTYAFRDITGGQLTYSHSENYRVEFHEGDIKNTFDPVVFRNKPVKIQWQAIPWENGSILVRIYVRPSTQYYTQFFQNSPAYFDLVFEKSAATIGAGYSRKPTHQPDPYPDSPALEFSDDELVAGAAAALLMLLASLGLNVAMLAAQETASSVMVAGEDVAKDANIESDPPLVDPYDSEKLPEEDGMYWDGYGERWMTRDEAEHFISELNQEKSVADDRREQELDAFEKQNESDREQRRTEREQRLRDEGNIYDEDQDAWVRDPKLDESRPSRPPTDEYYDRGDYIQSHLSELSKEQREAAERILDRIGWNASALNPDGSINNEDLDEKNQEDMLSLSHIIDDLLTGKHQSEMAQAEHDAIDLEHNEKIAEKIADAGEMAANYLEGQYLPTKGAISGFVFQGIQSADKGMSKALYDGFVSSMANVVGNRLGDSRKGDVLWNAMAGGLTSSAETGAKGGNADDMIRSGLFSFFLSGASEHGQNYASRNDGKLFDLSDWWHSRSNIDIHTRINNLGETNISSHKRSGTSEEDMVKGIRESVANNERLQNAEAAAERLRRGDELAQDSDQSLAEGKNDWYASDRANGQTSSGHIRTIREVFGMDRTRYMEQAINSGKHPDLSRIDRGIRDAWTEARFDNSPDSWSKFQSELKARDISDTDYTKWEEVALSGPSKEAGAAVMDTVIPDSNPGDMGSDTIINHHHDNTFVGSDDTFIKGHHANDTIVESSRTSTSDIHQDGTTVGETNTPDGKTINNNDTVIDKGTGNVDT